MPRATVQAAARGHTRARVRVQVGSASVHGYHMHEIWEHEHDTRAERTMQVAVVVQGTHRGVASCATKMILTPSGQLHVHLIAALCHLRPRCGQVAIHWRRRAPTTAEQTVGDRQLLVAHWDLRGAGTARHNFTAG